MDMGVPGCITADPGGEEPPGGKKTWAMAPEDIQGLAQTDRELSSEGPRCEWCHRLSMRQDDGELLRIGCEQHCLAGVKGQSTDGIEIVVIGNGEISQFTQVHVPSPDGIHNEDVRGKTQGSTCSVPSSRPSPEIRASPAPSPSSPEPRKSNSLRASSESSSSSSSSGSRSVVMGSDWT
ncbi:hypothetical protein F7725_020734 [Dissostichus mawsoni]|uniref:Uncharacterized protein n=1 Tax=Dissostichus mawsoni TaxID=36200 RepID=A0A7J5YE07_DISMA|nr:hypothetical protein F7725_020734 [Dissostichus mawsoni]